MKQLPIEIYSVESVRAIDRAAIDGAGIKGYTLMTRAGTAALQEIQAVYPDARHWAILCGGGNNGGDGYVLARLAAANGIDVQLIALVDPRELRGDAQTAYADCRNSGLGATPWTGSLDSSIDLVVDAILGSGLQRPVAGVFADAIAAINQQAAPVVALDMPAGLDGDSGKPLGAALRADLTVTFVALKSGLFLGAGRGLVGELRFADLSIPVGLSAGIEPVLRRIGPAELQRALPRRDR
ncbi:MAG TPA: NAD(P)H-hydrate epimerase, partial [Woeseiaceae bacterium]|nr:NAD(P)H-hydrate epimerase [Woeseiaceae bacterium]